MRPIKFRQRIDNYFHFWGFINGIFVGPTSSSSGGNPFTSKHNQYSGLKDKNGVEIYEGDIVNCFDGTWLGAKVRLGDYRNNISEDHNGWHLWLEPDRISAPLVYGKDAEVVGNIYEKK